MMQMIHVKFLFIIPIEKELSTIRKNILNISQAILLTQINKDLSDSSQINIQKKTPYLKSTCQRKSLCYQVMKLIWTKTMDYLIMISMSI